MNTYESVEKIVKEYFDNAIIIDDQLNLSTTENEKIAITDDEIGDFLELEQFNHDFNTNEQIAAAADVVEDANKYNAFSAFQSLIRKGFITLPWKYQNDVDVVEELEKLNPLLINSKLLVIDWNLEETKNKDFLGEASLTIIKRFCELNRGLKCVVIYTKEVMDDVKLKLCPEYQCDQSEDILFFEEKEPSSLFGFVMSKDINPDQIIKNISKELLKRNSTTMHFIESANLLDRNINETLTQFNQPFEKVLLTQIITSNMSNKQFNTFFNETLLSNALSELQSSERDNFFIYSKVKKLIELVNNNVTTEHITGLCSFLNINGGIEKELIKLLSDSSFKSELDTIINSTSSLESLHDKIVEITRKYYRDKELFDRNKNLILLFFALIEFYSKSSSPEDFEKVYKYELYRFTRLLKYINKNYDEPTAKNGSIHLDKQTNKYILCITPVCDTVRLQNINNKHKFIIGEKVDIKNKNSLSGTEKSYILAIPEDSKEEIIFVKFNFFDTTVIENNLLTNVDDYQYISTLKREYIQKIINLYSAYQSRAGVEELFCKESAYVNNFLKLIK
ncbi:hypothetical protein COE14_24635 [Bacillus thuringiensis]|uniref:hypothetical protein n=1 Tax=Bacillus thuringiensis TaxID=1428 RepID=UPI000BF3F3C6|nr:hypothetical protein [Bacillus thuringiensis]PEV08685.1 hypothetical protein CN418_24000 [Bacillus thuringiensis]PGW50629.1 hypothetical protein COE14_24635 [Bacillus thuringiensis]